MNNEKYRTEFTQDSILNLKRIAPHSIIVEGDPPKIENLNETLILIFAKWSGPSYAIAQKILIEITEANIKPFEILILDIDKLSLEYIKMLLEGNLAHGYSESVWIEKGKIVKSHKKREDLKPFIEYLIEKNTIH